MISTTVKECCDAYTALRAINDGVKLSHKPAWRVARLIGKLKSVVRDFDSARSKVIKDAGGILTQDGAQLPPIERREGESDAAWSARIDERRALVLRIDEQVRGLEAEAVEVDYDPIPLAIFADDEKVPASERMRFNANHFADAGVFISDEPTKSPA